jgi:hypothetical protein
MLTFARLGFDPNAFSKDSIMPDPSVHQSSVISDLETGTIDRFEDVQVFIPAYLTKHDVSYRKGGRINGRDSAKLTRFNPSLHGRASRTKRDGFSCL